MKHKTRKKANGKARPKPPYVPISATVLPDRKRRVEKIAGDQYEHNVSRVVRIAIDEFLERRAS